MRNRTAVAARIGAVFLVVTLAAVVAPVFTAVHAQATGSDGNGRVAVGTPVTGATPAPIDTAVIRDTLNRPPARHSIDWVDVVEFPLKVVGWPLDLVLLRFPAWLAGHITAPRPPSFITRGYRAAAEWGFKPAIQPTIGPRSSVALEQQFTRYEPFYAHAAVSQRLSQRYRVGVRLDGDLAWFATEVRWQRDAERPFHGIGSQTSEFARAFYRRDYWDGYVRTGLSVTPFLAISTGAGYEHNTVGDPVADTESIFTMFPVNTLFGAEEQTEYARLELGGQLDLTRWDNFQQKGLSAGVEGRLYLGQGETASDFRQVNGFVHSYIPLNGQQTFAIRIVSSMTRSENDQDIPFYHLSSLGGSRSALGFPTSRFVDNDMVSFMSEYRFEVWRELHSRTRAETFLFFHYGAVGETLGQIEAGDWHPTYGVGMRMSTPAALLGLGYIGFSGEGITAGIRASWPF